jgi:hypothetical protein
MNNMDDNPHVVHGEFVTEHITLHLSPSQWQVTLIDMREDHTCLQSNELTVTDAQEHVEYCVDEFIKFVKSSDVMLQSLRRNGVSQGHNTYPFQTRLQEFFWEHGVETVAPNYHDWGQRGFIWAGLHSDICLPSSITSIRLTYPHFHHYILGNCTVPMSPNNTMFMHNYARQAWDNTTLLNTAQTNMKVITYE